MGETNFNSLKRTELLKRLTGEDLIPFEFKNKDPFTDKNYAKIIIATNSLPITFDKTTGFYRRWLTITFPNTFPEGVDILSTIPENEYNNLARKSIKILRDLLSRGKFTNEGTVEERRERYERLSNPVMIFISEYCERDENKEIKFSDFFDELTSFLFENGYRVMTAREVGMALKREGFEKKNKTITVVDEYGNQKKTSVKVIVGIALKEKDDKEIKKGGESILTKFATQSVSNDILKFLRDNGSSTVEEILQNIDAERDEVIKIINELKKNGNIFEESPGKFRIS